MNGQSSSYVFQATGMKENFSGFSTFGCRTWIRPLSKFTAKFKHNIVKGIFLGVTPRTKWNILWYNCERGKIGPTNQVKFDEGMNDLPFNNLLSNQRDLERAELGNKLPAELEEIEVEDELQFYVYPFAKMEEKMLKVPPTCTCPNFGLQFEYDSQYNCAYVLDVDAKSSAAKLFLSFKASWKAIRLSYIIVEISGRCIFTKSEATNALSKLRNEGVSQFHIMFTIEPALNARQRRHNANELALFDSRTKLTGNELSTNDLGCVHADFSSNKCITVTDHRAQSRVDPDTAKLSLFQDVEDIEFEDVCDDDYPQLDIVSLRAILALRSRLDFSEESIPTNIMLTVIVTNFITTQAITSAEQALGKFTGCKLKNMDTWLERLGSWWTQTTQSIPWLANVWW